MFSLCAIADTTLSRDGEGLKHSGFAFSTIRSKSLGLKGNTFACFSTLSRMSWEIKVVATTTTDNAMLPFLMYYNNDSSVLYPVTNAFSQWQNAPISKSPTITHVCLKGYSTATIAVPKTAFMVAQ